MFKKIIFLFIFCLFIFAMPAYCIQINGFNPSRHARFLDPDNPAKNPDFFMGDYDWSGVGWNAANRNQSVTMISPQHFVGAKHYIIPTGRTVSFLNRDGEIKSYVIEGYSEVGFSDGSSADLILGCLREPIPETDKVAYYSVIDADNKDTSEFETDWYLNKELLCYGWSASVGLNNIDSFNFVQPSSNDRTFCMAYDYHTNNANYLDEAGLLLGDSGSPAFIANAGHLTIAGTHYAISSGEVYNNYDSFVSYYINDLNTAMFDKGYSVATYVVPEPSIIILFMIGLFGIVYSNAISLQNSGTAS